MRGYFSLLQYCPDSAKAEAANVGVVLLCPEAHYFDGKLANGNDRVRRFFGLQGDALDRLSEMKQEFHRRLQIERPRMLHPEDFERFVATRANKLLLTPPRNLRLEDPEEELTRLYRELVGGRAMGEPPQRKGQGISVRTRLREIFSRPELEGLIAEDVVVTPRFGRTFTAPYAFYNGKASFIAPLTIHVDRDQTLREAEALTFRGIQLARHGTDQRAAELIVPLPSPEPRLQETTEEVLAMLDANQIRTFTTAHLDDLAEEIRTKAHTIPSR